MGKAAAAVLTAYLPAEVNLPTAGAAQLETDKAISLQEETKLGDRVGGTISSVSESTLLHKRLM